MARLALTSAWLSECGAMLDAGLDTARRGTAWHGPKHPALLFPPLCVFSGHHGLYPVLALVYWRCLPGLGAQGAGRRAQGAGRTLQDLTGHD